MIRRSQWINVVSVLAGAMMVACNGGGGGGSGGGSSGGSTTSGLSLSGSVHAGQRAVIASQVTAYSAGNGTLGSNAKPLACITTDANGHFAFGSSSAVDCGNSLPTSLSCPSSGCPSASSQIYVVAFGGDPGLAPINNALPNNTALALMAVLGPYSTLSSSSTVNITELTTVAATYSLGQMMGAASNGGIAGNLQYAGIISAKSPWLDHSVSLATRLVNVVSSAPGTALPVPSTCAGTSSDPVNCSAEEKINSVADALSTCDATSGPTSSACAQLFCLTTPGATFSGGTCTPPTSGQVPTNTLESALAIALNPGTVPASGIFSLATGASPFTPAPTTAPTEYSLALTISPGSSTTDVLGMAIDAVGDLWLANVSGTVIELSPSGTVLSGAGFTGGGLINPTAIAIDASGNVWVANFSYLNNVSEFNDSGAPLSPSAGYTGGGLSSEEAIATDAGGNAWITADEAITKLSPTGAPLSPSTGFTGGGLGAGPSIAQAIAIDANGNAWVANYGAGSNVSELSPNGVALSPSSGFTGGGIDNPTGIAIAPNGNVWVANLSGDVTELSPGGAPLSPSNGFLSGEIGPYAVAVDAGGNVWLTSGYNIVELNSTGTPLSPLPGFPIPQFQTGIGATQTTPQTIAIDGSGNVWVAYRENSNGSVTELIGAATPVKTPLIGPPQPP